MCGAGVTRARRSTSASPNNELQRTSDGNAAGSPLNSVFDRPAQPSEVVGGVTDRRTWLSSGVASSFSTPFGCRKERGRPELTSLTSEAFRAGASRFHTPAPCCPARRSASSQHWALERERSMEHGAGLTPAGRTGEPRWLSLASHAPFHGYHSWREARVRRLRIARARRAVEQCVEADEVRVGHGGAALAA